MKNNTLVSALTIIGILALGGVALFTLLALRPTPPKSERPKVVPLVSAVVPEVEGGSITISGNGTVRAKREINLVAEVSGKILALSSSAEAGGFFQEGDELFRLDPSDYENAVDMAEAEVTQREYELLLARQEVNVARQEWERLQRQRGELAPPETTALGSLVFREPQLKLAESLLKSAEARLEDARLRLARTRIRAPFNGRVRQKLVDIGQYVTPGQAVAGIYSTDELEIPVPFQSSEAMLIDRLWQRETNRGIRIPARVLATFGSERYEWEGYVDRTEGTLDAATRTINVVVRVPQPYRATGENRPPLLVGMYTRVDIEGATYDTYYVIPRAALKDGDTVWVKNDGRLEIRSVDIIQESDGNVFVRSGIAAGDSLVTSKLDVFSDGMEIRTTTE